MITRRPDKNRPWDEVKQCDRCQAVASSTGQRCRRNSCKIANYCFSHLKTHMGLEVRDTESYGRALFTTIPRRRGSLLCTYNGDRLTSAELESRYPLNTPRELATYVLQVSKDLFIDARSTQSCIGRYANSCDQRKTSCNARFSVHKREVSIKATKNIMANEQIFIQYGPDYRL